MVSSATTPSCSFMSCFLLFMILLLNGSTVSAQLSGPSFYSATCPKVYSIVEDAVNSAVKNESRMGASLLRLFFHDCFVNGCDASILLDDTANFTGEKTAFPNVDSARGFEVIDVIKSKVEAACKGIVSCADILALAARDAVVMLGGYGWQVQLGRRDSTTANYTGANTDLPFPSFNLTDLIAAFQNKGFTAKEMIVLSGAHTIGQARCVVFRDRIYNDIDINSTFASSLKLSCPSSGGDNNISPLDTTTSNKFDNAYFKNLQLHEGLLHSDQQLFSGGSADSDVASYASNPHLFQADFGKAMVKMGSLSPITGSDGQIRANCRIVAV